jgi:hypothetical protein
MDVVVDPGGAKRDGEARRVARLDEDASRPASPQGAHGGGDRRSAAIASIAANPAASIRPAGGRWAPRTSAASLSTSSRGA